MQINAQESTSGHEGQGQKEAGTCLILGHRHPFQTPDGVNALRHEERLHKHALCIVFAVYCILPAWSHLSSPRQAGRRVKLHWEAEKSYDGFGPPMGRKGNAHPCQASERSCAAQQERVSRGSLPKPARPSQTCAGSELLACPSPATPPHPPPERRPSPGKREENLLCPSNFRMMVPKKVFCGAT